MTDKVIRWFFFMRQN